MNIGICLEQNFATFAIGIGEGVDKKQKQCRVHVQVLCGLEFTGTQISGIPNFQESKFPGIKKIWEVKIVKFEGHGESPAHYSKYRKLLLHFEPLFICVS